jgi:hypothetical protein
MYEINYLIHDSHFPCNEKNVYSPVGRCHLCPVWSHVLPLNLTYISSATVLSDPVLYILLTFEVPNLIHFLSLRSLIQGIRPGPRLLVIIRNKLIFYGEELSPRPTPKLEDHLLLALRDCLFNIFAATHHIWRPSPPSATWGRAMPWWQGTHLTWTELTILLITQCNPKRDRPIVRDHQRNRKDKRGMDGWLWQSYIYVINCDGFHLVSHCTVSQDTVKWLETVVFLNKYDAVQFANILPVSPVR